MLLSPGLRGFLIIPLLINVLLYGIALTLGYYYMTDVINHFIPDWLHWLRWLLWPLFFACFFIVGFFTFTVMANLIAAPFYEKLAAKTLELISGQASTSAEQSLGKIMLAALHRLFYFAVRALGLVILSLIPGINILAPFLWAWFGAWSMALEYLAYPLENEGVLFDEQKRLAKEIRFGALSFGGLTMLGLTLPVVNIVIAPAAVIGATVYVYNIKDQSV
jgi:CysZ protein